MSPIIRWLALIQSIEAVYKQTIKWLRDDYDQIRAFIHAQLFIHSRLSFNWTPPVVAIHTSFILWVIRRTHENIPETHSPYLPTREERQGDSFGGDYKQLQCN